MGILLSKYKHTIFNKEKQYWEVTEHNCPICMNAIQNNNNFIALDCSHKFHASCIFQTLSTNHDKCPICRGEIKYLYPHKNSFKKLLTHNRLMKRQMDEILENTPT